MITRDSEGITRYTEAHPVMMQNGIQIYESNCPPLYEKRKLTPEAREELKSVRAIVGSAKDLFESKGRIYRKRNGKGFSGNRGH